MELFQVRLLAIGTASDNIRVQPIGSWRKVTIKWQPKLKLGGKLRFDANYIGQFLNKQSLASQLSHKAFTRLDNKAVFKENVKPLGNRLLNVYKCSINKSFNSAVEAFLSHQTTK